MNALMIFLAAAFVSSASAVYHMHHEQTHLVTMRKAELMGIINCVSQSRDVHVCQEFSKCETMMAPQVIIAYKKCRQMYTGESWTKCRPHQELFPNPSIPSKIFDCIVANTHKETPEERMDMVKFEVCTRELYSHNCVHRHKHHGMY